jgi:hypothetical protein
MKISNVTCPECGAGFTVVNFNRGEWEQAFAYSISSARRGSCSF